MKCLEFRRLKLADPGRLPAKARRHSFRCRDCWEFAYALDELEARLVRTLSVSVPEGLVERILIRGRDRRTVCRRSVCYITKVFRRFSSWLRIARSQFASAPERDPD